MEFLLAAIGQMAIAFVIALVAAAAITLAARRFAPRAAQAPGGTIAIACVAVFVYLAALPWAV